MIGIDMPGQLKENDCSRTIAVAQSLNPHFPFPNRIDLSRTVKWCHLWSTGSLCYFVLTPLCAQRSSHVCWYLPTDLRTLSDIWKKFFARLLIFFTYLDHDIGPQILARLLIIDHFKLFLGCFSNSTAKKLKIEIYFVGSTHLLSPLTGQIKKI